jgi:hypothetical protein
MKEKENSANKEKSREPFPSQKTPTPPQEMDPSKEPVKHNEGRSEKDKKKS